MNTELEKQISAILEDKIGIIEGFYTNHVRGIDDAAKALASFIEEREKEKDENIRMLGTYEDGYGAAEQGDIKFINKWKPGETNSKIGQILQDKFEQYGKECFEAACKETVTAISLTFSAMENLAKVSDKSAAIMKVFAEDILKFPVPPYEFYKETIASKESGK